MEESNSKIETPARISSHVSSEDMSEYITGLLGGSRKDLAAEQARLVAESSRLAISLENLTINHQKHFVETSVKIFEIEDKMKSLASELENAQNEIQSIPEHVRSLNHLASDFPSTLDGFAAVTSCQSEIFKFLTFPVSAQSQIDRNDFSAAVNCLTESARTLSWLYSRSDRLDSLVVRLGTEHNLLTLRLANRLCLLLGSSTDPMVARDCCRYISRLILPFQLPRSLHIQSLISSSSLPDDRSHIPPSLITSLFITPDSQLDQSALFLNCRANSLLNQLNNIRKNPSANSNQLKTCVALFECAFNSIKSTRSHLKFLNFESSNSSSPFTIPSSVVLFLSNALSNALCLSKPENDNNSNTLSSSILGTSSAVVPKINRTALWTNSTPNLVSASNVLACLVDISLLSPVVSVDIPAVSVCQFSDVTESLGEMVQLWRPLSKLLTLSSQIGNSLTFILMPLFLRAVDVRISSLCQHQALMWQKDVNELLSSSDSNLNSKYLFSTISNSIVNENSGDENLTSKLKTFTSQCLTSFPCGLFLDFVMRLLNISRPLHCISGVRTSLENAINLTAFVSMRFVVKRFLLDSGLDDKSFIEREKFISTIERSLLSGIGTALLIAFEDSDEFDKEYIQTFYNISDSGNELSSGNVSVGVIPENLPDPSVETNILVV